MGGGWVCGFSTTGHKCPCFPMRSRHFSDRVGSPKGVWSTGASRTLKVGFGPSHSGGYFPQGLGAYFEVIGRTPG